MLLVVEEERISEKSKRIDKCRLKTNVDKTNDRHQAIQTETQ